MHAANFTYLLSGKVKPSELLLARAARTFLKLVFDAIQRLQR